MFYTDIQTLRGLNKPVDYGSGIEYADGLLQAYTASKQQQQEGLQIGLWLNGTAGCRDLVQHRLKENVKRLVQYLAEDCPARKVWLRIGYEFDNAQFGYSDDPYLYQQAFQYLVDACRKVEKCNAKVVFVWHSWAAGVPGNWTLHDFYPGDDYVDWVGVSIFSQLYTSNNTLGNMETLQSVLQFAQQHNKPIVVAESTPFGGIDRLHDPWNVWFQPLLTLIHDYDIAMWSYINCDWESQPMWHNVGFGDTRLSINQTIMKLWHEQVLQNPRFLQHGSLCPLDQRRSSSLLPIPHLPHLQLQHPLYLMLAILAVLMAASCCQAWCTNLRAYVPLNDDTNVEDDDAVDIEPNRSGYGTVES
jgi:hypothetical protein